MSKAKKGNKVSKLSATLQAMTNVILSILDGFASIGNLFRDAKALDPNFPRKDEMVPAIAVAVDKAILLRYCEEHAAKGRDEHVTLTAEDVADKRISSLLTGATGKKKPKYGEAGMLMPKHVYLARMELAALPKGRSTMSVSMSMALDQTKASMKKLEKLRSPMYAAYVHQRTDASNHVAATYRNWVNKDKRDMERAAAEERGEVYVPASLASRGANNPWFSPGNEDRIGGTLATLAKSADKAWQSDETCLPPAIFALWIIDCTRAYEARMRAMKTTPAVTGEAYRREEAKPEAPTKKKRAAKKAA
jgi:hypothetical protein